MCYGRTFHIAYFKAAHRLNPELEARYSANRVGLTRQLHFSERSEKSLDAAISVNGVPVATIELKNPLTGQTVNDAQRQYCQDRDPRELIFEFERRMLVHFAVDIEAVFMTTRLAGSATHFLPFNKGCDGGAGNPPDLQGRTISPLHHAAGNYRSNIQTASIPGQGQTPSHLTSLRSSEVSLSGARFSRPVENNRQGIPFYRGPSGPELPIRFSTPMIVAREGVIL